MKKCFKCGVSKRADLFYKHPMMKDGRLGKCIACTKKDVAERYLLKRNEIREYEKKRAKDPARKAKKLLYERKRRKLFPGKDKARSLLLKAVRKGLISRLPCEICGDSQSQAHHKDYRRPYSVQWLCFKHHREVGHGQKVGPK